MGMRLPHFGEMLVLSLSFLLYIYIYMYKKERERAKREKRGLEREIQRGRRSN